MPRRDRKLQVIAPTESNDIMFTCWVDDANPVHAPTRDEALFYAGWWAGRRELAKQIGVLVERGERARVVIGDDDEGTGAR